MRRPLSRFIWKARRLQSLARATRLWRHRRAVSHPWGRRPWQGHGQHHIRRPEHLAQHDGADVTAKLSRCSTRLRPPGVLGTQGAHATHRPMEGFALVAVAHVVRVDFPPWVVRRCGHNAHVMSFSCQPLSHLSGIFTDACGLGRIVGAVDQNFHHRSSTEGMIPGPCNARKSSRVVRSTHVGSRPQGIVRSDHAEGLCGVTPQGSRCAPKGVRR